MAGLSCPARQHLISVPTRSIWWPLTPIKQQLPPQHLLHAPSHTSCLAQGRVAELQQRAAEQQQEHSHLQEQIRQLQLQVEHVQGEKNLAQVVSRQEAAAEVASLKAKVLCCAWGTDRASAASAWGWSGLGSLSCR